MAGAAQRSSPPARAAGRGHARCRTSRNELTAAARAAAAGGHTIIVAGGDGTVHHVVNALASVPSTIGILPSGTGNDFARALGLPLDVVAAAARLAQGRTRRVDLAEVNGRVFCTVGGTGLMARSTVGRITLGRLDVAGSYAGARWSEATHIWSRQPFAFC